MSENSTENDEMNANREVDSPNIDIPVKDEQGESKGGFIGLIAIIVAIVLGVLTGFFYGETMWISGGGPESKLVRYQETIEQKREFAKENNELAAEFEEKATKEQGDVKKDLEEQAAKKREEAERLLKHIPDIEEEIETLKPYLKPATRAALENPPADPKEFEEVETSTIAGFWWILTEFLGDLFLQMLKMMVIPLVVTSMICGITSLGDIRNLGRVGSTTIIYYMITTGIAVIIGIVLVVMIQPGVDADDTFAFVESKVSAKEGSNALETLLNVVRGQDGDNFSKTGMFPQNIFQAASNTNVLAVIVFALVFGGVLTTMGKRAAPVIHFFEVVNAVIMKMVHLIMYIAPIGIYGLVTFNIAKNGGWDAFGGELSRLSMYVLTVIFGLSLHAVALALILWVVAKRNPITYVAGIVRALLTAFSTASSSATMPITMDCVEKNNKVSNRAASFVLPLGATINMDGTALYEAVAVIFIAQSIQFELTFASLVVIFLTATLAAIGAAGIPEAGLVTMVIVLTAVGMPTAGIGTILAIDWFLDRLRTTLNVFGDACGAAVIDEIAVRHESPAT